MMVEMVAMVAMVEMVVEVVMMMMATICLIDHKYAQGKDARRLAFVLYPVQMPHYTAWLA